MPNPLSRSIFRSLAIGLGAMLLFSGGAFAQTGPCTTSGYTSTYSQCSNNQNRSSTTVTNSDTVRIATAQTSGLIAERIASFGGSSSAPGMAMGPTRRLGMHSIGMNGNIGVKDGETGLAAGDAGAQIGLWINGGYSDFDVDTTGANFDGNTWTGAIGADFRVMDNLIAGLAVAYENTDVDTTFNLGTIESDGFTVAPYAVFLVNKMMSVDVSGGYTWLDYDTTRKDPITLAKITGSTDADRWFASLNVNTSYAFEAWRLGGRLGTLYAHEEQDAFSESNGEAVIKASTSVGDAHLGARLGYDLGGIQPFVSVLGRWFWQDGRASDDTDAVIGAGVSFHVDNLTGSIIGTSVQGRSNTDNYSISANVRLSF